jgi:D-alanine--D-alanine ligase
MSILALSSKKRRFHPSAFILHPFLPAPGSFQLGYLNMFKIAVICGGPSLERGISLNSARSVMDHLSSPEIEIVPVYVNYDKEFFAISCGQLYSNTPADFDFKLSQTATKLDERSLERLLKEVDLVFPVIHGPFGEDGQLQSLLEKLKVPYIGSESKSCQQFFHKYNGASYLRKKGYNAFPSLLLTAENENLKKAIADFFEEHQLKRAIVKPVIGGSSIGVSSVNDPAEAFQKSQELFQQGIYKEAMLEPFCQGKEFTILVVESLEGEPIPLIPTEIEMNYSHNQIFDYRKKYLATNQAAYHTPPRFSSETISEIRTQAKEVFSLFKMRDFVRLDGWVMPDQSIYFTDMNPISGLEQNSFLFRQSALVGMTHQEILLHLVKGACKRKGIPFSENKQEEEQIEKTPVYVLFGGSNAERQVSLMSGTNIWLKLRRSKFLTPTPFLFDFEGHIWELPYSYSLNHTVEEIYQNCLHAEMLPLYIKELINSIQDKLHIGNRSQKYPKKMTLDQFIIKAKEEKAFVFIGMHGGIGEDGTLQTLLEKAEIPFNGSDSETSALCMDKFLTGEKINALNDPEIFSVPKRIINLEIVKNYTDKDCEKLWNEIQSELQSDRLLVKPRCDGCSAGIALLNNAHDLERYIEFIRKKVSFIPAGTFLNQKDIIEMPSHIGDYILEPYIETDSISIEKTGLKHCFKTGWIELTVGILEDEGDYHAMNPSITIAEGAVLSLEEKFQGGTGINLTPPPEAIVSKQAAQKIKRLIEKTAEALGIRNYSRIDIFFNLKSEKMIVIEANTLPGLTPSTVIYHQGIAEEISLTPTSLLEKIIVAKLKSPEYLTTVAT